MLSAPCANGFHYDQCIEFSLLREPEEEHSETFLLIQFTLLRICRMESFALCYVWKQSTHVAFMCNDFPMRITWLKHPTMNLRLGLAYIVTAVVTSIQWLLTVILSILIDISLLFSRICQLAMFYTMLLIMAMNTFCIHVQIVPSQNGKFWLLDLHSITSSIENQTVNITSSAISICKFVFELVYKRIMFPVLCTFAHTLGKGWFVDLWSCSDETLQNLVNCDLYAKAQRIIQYQRDL